MKSVAILFSACIVLAIIAHGSTQKSEAGRGSGAAMSQRRGLFSRGLFTRAGNFMAATGAMGKYFI